MQEEEKLYSSLFKPRYTMPKQANFKFMQRYPPRVEDTNAMDINAMTIKEHNDLM